MCFSDGDDYVMPNYVEHLLKLCLTYHADVAYTVDMYTTFHNEHIANSQVKVITPEDATENILCYKVPIGVYSKLFNREFLVKNNIHFWKMFILERDSILIQLVFRELIKW